MAAHFSHIWLGKFGPKSPESYFVQQFENDDAPMCQFAAEQEEQYFDYDFVEISFPDEARSIRLLVDGHSYSESYLELVVKKAAKLEIAEANVFVLANEDEFAKPRSVSGEGYHLWYLGKFECQS